MGVGHLQIEFHPSVRQARAYRQLRPTAKEKSREGVCWNECSCKSEVMNGVCVCDMSRFESPS